MMGRRCYNPTPAAGVSRRFGSEKASSISSSLSFSVPLSLVSTMASPPRSWSGRSSLARHCQQRKESFRVKISCGLASRGLVQGERKAAERGGSPHASWPSRLPARMMSRGNRSTDENPGSFVDLLAKMMKMARSRVRDPPKARKMACMCYE